MIIEQQYLAEAKKIARLAEKIFLQDFGHPGKIRTKNNDPRNMVTAADIKIEKLIRKHLSRAFPEHQIIGEEFGLDKLPHKKLFWIIDPIDGTTNYIHGIPITCISIALWDNQGPLVSLLTNPILKQTYTAIRAKGARLNEKPIKVTKVSKLIDAVGALGWLKPKEGVKIISQIIPDSKKVRVFASSAWQICMVASGNLDFYLTNELCFWDFAAAALVIKEAGGKITDMSGKTLSAKSTNIIAANPLIYPALLKKSKSFNF